MGGIGSGRKPNPNKPLDPKTQRRHDEKVTQLFAHPRLETIPNADFPLGKVGSSKYRELAEMLLKSGQLTVITKGFAEMAALAFEEIHNRQSSGKSVSANLIQRYQSALGNIHLLDVDRQTPGATSQKLNRFRYSGFANRLR